MGIKIIARNKRAGYDYFLLEKFEAGLILKGTEVKSLREGKASLANAHITIDQANEAWAHNISIPPYEHGNMNNHQENRKRKLLLHRKELLLIQHRIKAGGMAIIPLALYFKKSHVKLEIALAKGKKKYDKRQVQAQKEVKRKLQKGQYNQ